MDSTLVMAAIVLYILTLCGLIAIASRVDKLDRAYKKYIRYIDEGYQKFQHDDYEARHKYDNGPKYAPGGKEDRL